MEPTAPHDEALPPAHHAIHNECQTLEALLLRKNRQYGNSALEPLGICAKAPALEQIAARIDDKLKRISNQGGLAACLLGPPASDGEDTVLDLIGYLVLARVCAYSCIHATEQESAPAPSPEATRESVLAVLARPEVRDALTMAVRDHMAGPGLP